MGWFLVLAAVVPLAGVAIGIRNAVARVDESTDEVRRTAQLVDDAAIAVYAEDSAWGEVWWATVAQIGLSVADDPALLEMIFGFDLEAERRDAQADTDEYLALLDDPLLDDEMATFRTADDSLEEVVAAFGPPGARIESTVDRAIDRLRRAPAIDGADEAIDIVDAILLLRRSIADSVFGLFAIDFALRDDPATELAGLITVRADFEHAMARLAELQPTVGSDESELTTALLATEPAFDDFLEALSETIDERLATGVPPEADALEPAAVLLRIDQLQAMYEFTDTAAAAASTAMESASEELDLLVADAVDAAERDRTQKLALAAILSVCIVLSAIVVTLAIVRPLRRLRRAADGLRTPGQEETPPVGGPLEVRAAADAIDDAARHLDLLTAQSRALAAGELDAAVLDVEAPGGLGTAVQGGVARLREALETQDEFRRRLAHETSHDGLTKLSNRTASTAHLRRSLARTARADSQLAVLFVDVDDFKDVNEVHGHHVGDLVLTTVAQRLVNVVRDGDHVGRLGGDEFVVIAEPIADVNEAIALAERLSGAVSQPIALADGEESLGIRVGIAIADGAHLTADELLHDADLAVHRSKRSEHDRIVVCDEALRRELAHSADLATSIRAAIDEHQFVMHYQPIVDAVTHEVTAHEALIRWHPPDHDSPIPPGVFIPFAERHDLIIELDRWVVGTVVSELAAAVDSGTHPRPVSVNVSGRHLAHDGFVEHVLDPIDAHGVDPNLLIVEVTESALLEDLASASIKLERLRSRGIRVAIDDFGTGYTSLAHLRALPFDTLKIDRSFVVDDRPDGISLLNLIVDTGHLLGVTVTAEGIETEPEADRLRLLGCDSLQGYLFGRPTRERASHPLAGAATT